MMSRGKMLVGAAVDDIGAAYQSSPRARDSPGGPNWLDARCV